MTTSTPSVQAFWNESIMKNRVLRLFLVFIGVLVFFALIFPDLLDMPRMDENIYVYEGWLIAKGMVPYRDFFEFLTPLTPYISGAIMALSGNSLVVLRLATLLCLLSCIGITLRLVRPLLPTSWLVVLALVLWFIQFPLNFQFQHHLVDTTMSLIAVWWLSRYVQLNQTRYLVLSGMFVGLTGLATQSFGVTLFLGLNAFLILFTLGTRPSDTTKHNLITRLGLFFISALAPLLILLLYYAGIGNVSNFWQMAVMWVMKGTYADTTMSWYFAEGFLKLFPTTPDGTIHVASWSDFALTLLLGWLPVLGLIWPIDIVRKKTHQTHPLFWQLLLLWIAGFSMWIGVFSNPNRMVVGYHSFLLYGLAMVAFYYAFKHHTKTKWVLASLLVVLLTTQLFLLLLRSAYMSARPSLMSYGTAEGMMLPPESMSDESIGSMNRMINGIHEHASQDDTIFIYNQEPQLYVMTNQQNATRYYLLMKHYSPQEEIDEAFSDLKAKTPRYIIYDQKDERSFKYDMRFEQYRGQDHRLMPIHEWVTTHYKDILQVDDFTVYKYRNTPAQSAH